LAAIACAVATGVLLAAVYKFGPLARFDLIALDGLESLQGPAPLSVCNWFAHTADPAPVAAMLAMLLVLGWFGGRRRQAVAAAVAVASANIATQCLKLLFAHPRAQPLLAGSQVGAASFPSGHATAAMSIALAAVIVAPPRLRLTVAPIAAAYPLAVSSSILILGWHFPSDVLGGILVAAAFAFASVALCRAIAGRRSDATPARQLVLTAPPKEVWLGALALGALVAASRASDLVDFARVHTTGAAALAAIAALSSALLASASLFADR
jgi:membrane-associated phospholipid phosphatase